jgi:histidine ammonia-lyase
MHTDPTPTAVTLNHALNWRELYSVAEGASLQVSNDTAARIQASRALVNSIAAKGIRAYGVNTGVGALCDVAIDVSQQAQLSRNLIMSHAVGVGSPLTALETRAIMAAQVNNFCHGYSGVRLELVAQLVALLNAQCTPVVPSQGSVGYLSHMAHIALVAIGEGQVHSTPSSGADALRAMKLKPLVLAAKEGLSVLNGTPCATGLATVVLARAERLLAWADDVSAMSFEALRGQPAAFDQEILALRQSPAINQVGARLRALLAGSAILAASAGAHTQASLSLRAIPQVHGAAHDVWQHTATIIDQELKAVTDNPIVTGTVDAPQAHSEAHAIGAALALAMDSLGIAIASVAAMSERRTDRLVNPLVSGLPAFLSAVPGVGSGFMIAQYTAASLVADNRRLAAPASLDGGITSALQEDHLCHATPAALKALKILDNAEHIVAIELLAATQAYDLLEGAPTRAPATEGLHQRVRQLAPTYADDRPLAEDIGRVRTLISRQWPNP